MVTIAPIVEGHGEVASAPILIRRIGSEMLDRVLDVKKPLRLPKSSLLHRPGELERYVELAARQIGSDDGILLLLDSDTDCAAELGSALLLRMRAARADRHIACVLAVCEFENWFLAGLSSLAGRRGFPATVADVDSAESVRDAKGLLKKLTQRPYSETADQPALASVIDLSRVRASSPSFDKLCRDLHRLADV